MRLRRLVHPAGTFGTAFAVTGFVVPVYWSVIGYAFTLLALGLVLVAFGVWSVESRDYDVIGGLARSAGTALVFGAAIGLLVLVTRHAIDDDRSPRNPDLLGANLRHADLDQVVLTGADLSGADLSYVDLAGAKLTNVDLTGADLSNADLTGTDMTGADISGADLSGIRYDDRTVWPQGFQL